MSGTRSLLLIIMLCGFGQVFAQQTQPFNIYDHFLSTQFWLGIRSGVNLTQPHAADRFNGFSPINYDEQDVEKAYSNFNTPGFHVGIDMNFYYKRFGIAFQPTFKRSVYEYQTTYEWTDGTEAAQFETSNDIRQRLDIIEFPLSIKANILQIGKFTPFAQAGAFYSVIASSQKDVEISQVDNISGTPVASDIGRVSIGVKDAFKNYYGVLGGIGVNFDYFNIRTIFDVSYRMALSSVTRENYVVNELASIGDVNDKVQLRDLSFTLSFVFPFRYVDRQFMPY